MDSKAYCITFISLVDVPAVDTSTTSGCVIQRLHSGERVHTDFSFNKFGRYYPGIRAADFSSPDKSFVDTFITS